MAARSPYRRRGETADAYLRRLERRPDFAGLCGSYLVQYALAEAAREAARARREAERPARAERAERGA